MTIRTIHIVQISRYMQTFFVIALSSRFSRWIVASSPSKGNLTVTHPYTIILHAYSKERLLAVLEWWGVDSTSNPFPSITKLIIRVHRYGELTDDAVECLLRQEVELLCEPQVAAMFKIECVRSTATESDSIG